MKKRSIMIGPYSTSAILALMMQAGPVNAGLRISNSAPDLPDVDTRIIGGTTSQQGQFPFFVQLLENFMGGSLIAPRVVLSAGRRSQGRNLGPTI